MQGPWRGFGWEPVTRKTKNAIGVLNLSIARPLGKRELGGD